MATQAGSDGDARRETGAGPAGGGRADSDAPTAPAGRAEGPDRPRLATGARVHRYVVEAWLGAGTFGEVYRARDTALQRDVALKTLLGPWTRDAAAVARFRREAEALARISHPNVAAVYDVIEHDERVFIVMEFVAGPTLAERIKAGPIDPRESLIVALQVARGLGAAHERGVIHRDLKPANVMLGEGGAKVLDFGLAKRFHEGTGDSARRAVLGTPGYMSPEQAAGEEIDHRADVWAFGCVLFECLTGRRAFLPGRASPEWSVLPDATPESVRELLARCLEPDAGARPASMREIAGVLGAATRQEEGAAPARSPLPLEADSFIGRGREAEDVRGLLGQSRLVTVLGPGGCGKTRLALRLAREAHEQGEPLGAAWLASLSDPAHVPQAVAASLGARAPSRGVEAIAETVGDRPTLLVLDNCEHLSGAVSAFVRDALARVPGLRVLATSREPLHVPGERVYLLGGLSVPPPGEWGVDASALERFASVRLFVERARASDPTFRLTPEAVGHVARICAGVGGLPLAIELAAARVRALPLGEIADRLGDSMRLLRRGAGTSGRHDTLDEAMGWSFRTLTPEEQETFLALSVFSGGCSLDAAIEVCGPGRDEFTVIDLLARLVDKSLLVFDREGERYRMLEPVLAFARARADGETDVGALRRRHAAHFVALGERLFRDHGGPNEAAALDRFQRDHDNFLGALEHLAGESADAESGLRLANVLVLFWQARGYIRTGLSWLERLIAARAGAADALQARGYNAAAILAWSDGDRAKAREFVDAGIAIAGALGDDARLARCCSLLGILHKDAGDLRAAREAHARAQALYAASRDAVRAAQESLNLAVVTIHEGDLDEAESLLGVCLPAFRKKGDRFREAAALRNLADIAMTRSDFDRARDALAQAWRLRRDMSHLPSCASLALLLGVCALRLGRDGEAAALLVACEKIRLAAGVSRTEEEERVWEEARAASGVGSRVVLAPGDGPDTLLAVVDRWLGAADDGRAVRDDRA